MVLWGIFMILAEVHKDVNAKIFYLIIAQIFPLIIIVNLAAQGAFPWQS
jgi:hypothetical protein